MILAMFKLDKLRANLKILTEGISDNKLWELTGIQQTTISRLKAGKIKAPSIDLLSKLADHFGISVSQLIGDEPLVKDVKYKELENMLDHMPAHRRVTIMNIAHTIAQEPEPPYQ
jgi:transcriptional regulator with XRE-family HTH domain